MGARVVFLILVLGALAACGAEDVTAETAETYGDYCALTCDAEVRRHEVCGHEVVTGDQGRDSCERLCCELAADLDCAADAVPLDPVSLRLCLEDISDAPCDVEPQGYVDPASCRF